MIAGLVISNIEESRKKVGKSWIRTCKMYFFSSVKCKPIKVVFDTILRVCRTIVRVLMSSLFLALHIRFGLGLGQHVISNVHVIIFLSENASNCLSVYVTCV